MSVSTTSSTTPTGRAQIMPEHEPSGMSPPPSLSLPIVSPYASASEIRDAIARSETGSIVIDSRAPVITPVDIATDARMHEVPPDLEMFTDDQAANEEAMRRWRGREPLREYLLRRWTADEVDAYFTRRAESDARAAAYRRWSATRRGRITLRWRAFRDESARRIRLAWRVIRRGDVWGDDD